MVDNKINVLIDSMFDAKGFNAAARASSQLNKTFRATARNAEGALGEKTFAGSGVFEQMKSGAAAAEQMRLQEGYVNQFGLSLSNLADAAQKNPKAFKALQTSMNAGGYDTFNAKVMSSNTLLKKFGISSKRVKREFQMQFLGVMFLGMQLQKTFSTLAKSSVSSFMKITEGMHPAAQAVNALTATWELLKFSIGEALATVIQQLLPALIPIIVAFADWVQQNQKLVGWVIILGIALGGVLFFVGQMFLGITALLQALAPLKAAFTGMELWATIASASFGTILLWIGIIIAAVLILWAMWEANFANIQEFTAGTIGIIVGYFKSLIADIKQLGKDFKDIFVKLFSGDISGAKDAFLKFAVTLFKMFAKLVAGIILLLMNFGKLFQNLWLSIWQILISIFAWFVSGLVDMLVDMAKSIIKFFVDPIRSVIDFLNGVIRNLNKIPGVELSYIGMDASDSEKQFIKIDRAAEQAKEGLKSLISVGEEASTGFLQELKTDDFFNMDDYNKINQAIEDNDKFSKSLQEVQKNTESTEQLFSTEGPLASMITDVEASFDTYSSLASEAASTSATLAENNYLEAESWNYKSEAIEKNNDAIKQNTELLISLGDAAGVDMSDVLPNSFITK